MNIINKLNVLCVLLGLSILACHQKDTALTPSPTIDGTYQATLYRTDANGYSAPATNITTVVVPYPINGHSLTMTIESITEDSARVLISPLGTSTSTGIFSPVQPLSFPKAYVKKEAVDGDQKRYFIYLTSDQPQSELNDGILIYGDGKLADYFFNLSAAAPLNTPPLPKARIAIKFEKLY